MKQPNIVFIAIDDLGCHDLSVTGSRFYESPAIDKLAANGVSCTAAYAAAPVCSPSRAALLTGQSPARLGVTNFIDWTGTGHPSKGLLIDAPYIDHLPAMEKNLPKSLSEQGYSTWHVGKWHLGGEEYYPDRQGFDENYGGFYAGMPPNGYFAPWKIPTMPEGEAGEYLTDALTDKAVNLIKERNRDRPFFLNLWYYSVHIPIQAPEDLIEKYRAKAEAMGLTQRKTFVEGDFFPCEHKKNKRIQRRILQSDPAYAAMIERLDYNIGRLLAELEKQEITEETIIVFTSDNGGLSTAEGAPTCNLPQAEGKGWTYEGGIRVPLIFSWPGKIPRGVECAWPTSGQDIFPTLMDLIAAPLQENLKIDGISVARNLIQPEQVNDGRNLFWHYPHYGNQGGTPGSAMRKEQWKLIHFYETDIYELYDLENDPSETSNLAGTMGALESGMKKELAAWRKAMNALTPEPNPEYRPWPGRTAAGRAGETPIELI